MHVTIIAGDTNWVEVHCGIENEHCLAGQCSVTSNYGKKNYLIFRAGSSVWGVLTGLLLT
jgi:hypothetical protein